MNKMWFGIPGSHMQWVPCPSIDSVVQRNRYTERMQFENGGGDARRSAQYQMEYQFNFSGPAHEVEGIDAFNKFAQGFYGDGLIYLAHPAAYETNLFPAAWASPGLIEQGWANIATDTPIFSDTNVTTYGQPLRTPTWTITDQAGTYTKRQTIVIPPTHTLHLGVSGIATGNGVVRVQPVNVNNTLGSVVNLTLLSKSGATRLNTTFSGTTYSAIHVYITRSSDTPTTRKNLVTNPGFDVSAALWTGNAATLSYDTSVFYSGIGSLKSIGTAGTANQGATSALSSLSGYTAGSKFTASAWVKGVAGQSLRIQAISNGTSASNGSTDFVATGNWQRVSATGNSIGTNPNSSDAWVSINSGASTTQTTFNVDNVLLEISPSMDSYFDGSTTNTSVTANSWNGTPGLSTSTQIVQDVSTVSITSMDARLYTTGTSPTLPTDHYQGEGSTGLMFADDAIVETYSYMFPPRKGIATTLVEVGAWR